MKTFQWKRVLRLTIAALVFLYIAFDLGLSWIFVDRLIKPGCAVPVGLSTADQPEVIDLLAEDGLAVEAWYYAPQNGAVIIAMGGVNGALGTALPPVAFLLNSGYGVLQVGSRSCTGALVTLGGREALDTAAAARWLDSQPAVERIGVIGFSMGGVTAIRTAVEHPIIEAVVAEGGYFNLGQDIVEPDSGWNPVEKVLLYTVAGVFWIRTGINPWLLSPVDDIGGISPRPVFLIYGEQEQYFGRAALQFESAKEPKTLWIVPSGNHGTNYYVAQAEYEARVLKYFDTWLLDDGPTQ